MKSTISNFIKNCEICKRNKHRIKTFENFVHTTTPARAFDLLSIDTVGPFTKTNQGHRYALSVQCDLSKYVIMTPLMDKQAITIAKALVDNVILIYGCPKAIKTDMGTEYKNDIMNNVCKILSIEHKFATAYHPQTIGSLERNHRFLNEYIRHFINEEHDDWDTLLSYYTFCYNTTPHSSTNLTPFELVFGKTVNFPQYLSKPINIEPVYNLENYYSELKFKIQKCAEKARELLDKHKRKRITTQENYSNPITVNIQDEIWLKAENRRKLDSVYAGPFEVLEIDHPNVTIINKTTKEIFKVHKNRIIKM